MDARLLVAINDVVRGGSLTNGALLADLTSAEAAPALQQSILRKAGTGNASTGRPIPSLHGISKVRATLAAVDGGAISTRGGGIVGGQRVLCEAAIKVQLASHGITAAIVVGEILFRYSALVRQDRKAAIEAPDAIQHV